MRAGDNGLPLDAQLCEMLVSPHCCHVTLLLSPPQSPLAALPRPHEPSSGTGRGRGLHMGVEMGLRRSLGTALLIYHLQTPLRVFQSVLQTGTHGTDLLAAGIEMINSQHFHYIAAKWLTCSCALFSRVITIFQHMTSAFPEERKLREDYLCLKRIC